MVALAIDDILRAAIQFDVKRRDAGMNLHASALDLFSALERAGVDYTLVGGIALLSFIPGRNTQDVDIIVDAAALPTIAWNGIRLDRDFGKASFAGVDVDLLFTDNPVFLHVSRQERGRIDFEGIQVPCASRAGLVTLKLYALPSLYRQANLARAALYEADVKMLLLDSVVDLEQIYAFLEPHLSKSDISELRRIVLDLLAPRRFA